MMTTAVIFCSLFLLSIVTALSIFEMGLSRVSKVTVRRLVQKHPSRSMAQLKVLAENRLESLISVYVGIQVCIVGFAILTTGYLHNRFQSYSRALPVAFGVMFLVVVVFRQLIPRIFTLKRPERVLMVMAPVYQILRPVLTVLAYPLSSTLKLFTQLNGDNLEEKSEEYLEEEIQAYIDVGKEQGILEKDQGPLIQSAVEFGDKVAGEIMTPRTEIVAIDVTSSLTQLKQVMTHTKYSRIPVYRDHAENIVGMAYLKDLLDFWDQPRTPLSLEQLMRPIHFVHETKRVSELLTELQRSASHMAMVMDEYGGLAGLVTIEDILEEIAGEIRDEDEAEEILRITQDKEGHYLIPGSLAIEQVEELFGIDLNHDENSTVAGFINSAFGRVPRRGERYEHQGILFEVKEANRRKVDKVSAVRMAQNPGEGVQATTTT